MISDLFSATVIIGIVSSGIRLATPYLFASIGEMFGQRSGVLNLGVEGQMLLGAFVAFYVTLNTQNLWLGVLAAMGVGALMGVVSCSFRTPFVRLRAPRRGGPLSLRMPHNWNHECWPQCPATPRWLRLGRVWTCIRLLLTHKLSPAVNMQSLAC